MSLSLSQKYRPKSFEEIVDQEHIKTTLLNEIRSKQMAHAYLFSGARGIGKTTTARILARAINCQGTKNGEPCNTCVSCVSILQGKAMDIIEIDAASHTGVDHVRENIISNARVSPVSLAYKVFIIDEVHMLSLSSFNALLKILEEPPAHAVFILATTEFHKIPETIVSRCQLFMFQRISRRALLERLEEIVKKEKIQVDLDVLEQVASRSMGYVRDAESLLGQILALDEKHITLDLAEMVLPKSHLYSVLDFLEHLLKKQTRQAVEMINMLREEGTSLHEWAKDFIELLRHMLLYKATQKLSHLDYLSPEKKFLDRILPLVDGISLKDLGKLLELFLYKPQEVRNSDIPELPLELAVISWCGEEKNSLSVFKPKANPPQSQELEEDEEEDTEKTKNTEEDTKRGKKTDITFEKIQALWPVVKEKCGKRNHSLNFTLGLATLLHLKGKKLTLGLPYTFHADRLHEAANTTIVEDALTEVFGENITLACQVSKDYLKSLETEEDAQKLVEQAFA